MARGKGEKGEAEAAGAAGVIGLAVASAPSAAVQERLAVLQRLESCRGKANDRFAQGQAAQALGLSRRSLRRLQQQYREQGMEGLKRQLRCDAGQLKLDATWREFIVETYRKGNRGMRQMSRSQVAKIVASRAAAQGSGA